MAVNQRPDLATSENRVLNTSYDRDFEVLVVEMLGYDPVTNTLNRMALNADGTAKTTPLAVRVDEASSTVSYIGEAAAGTVTSSSTWRIKKMDTSSGTVITWADGNTNFDNIFDNRASLTYS